jgi:hypothetical protein
MRDSWIIRSLAATLLLGLLTAGVGTATAIAAPAHGTSAAADGGDDGFGWG